MHTLCFSFPPDLQTWQLHQGLGAEKRPEEEDEDEDEDDDDEPPIPAMPAPPVGTLSPKMRRFERQRR